MNNRDYKIFYKGGYYHIYNRGNNKQNIFFDEQDYRFFLNRLKENILGEFILKPTRGYVRKLLPTGSFSIIAYCLMPNHFHFLLRQDASVTIDILMLKLCTSYSKYFNAKYEKVGHLFQDQYKSINVDNDSYLLWVSAYIHQNPFAAGIVSDLKVYPWSSYPGYLGLHEDVMLTKQQILASFASVGEYQKFVENSFETIKQKKDLESYLLD